MQLVMFSKHLGDLSVAEAGRRIAALGFDGVDLTVRPGGHVLPEAVDRDLPAAVRVLRDLGLQVPMITTAVTSAAPPESARIFAAAAQLGIGRLKLGYWPYRPFGTLLEQVDAARRDLDGIERLARQVGVCACIHSHSGNYLSAAAGNVYLLLKDRSPDHLAAYVDPGHMTVEGGSGGWRQGLDLLQRRIRLVAVKDFGWFQEPGAGGKKVAWRPKLVPLAEGIVPWPEVFACLRQTGFDGPVSVHSEYQGRNSWRDLSRDELLEQTRRDLDYLRPVLKGS